MSAYTGAKYRYDQYNLALSLSIPAKWFETTTIKKDVTSINPIPIRPTHPGVFLNDDVHVINNDYNAQKGVSAYTKLGLFNRFGVGTSDFLLSDTAPQTLQNVVRLDTAWEYDQPEHVTTWRFGDSISQSATWSDAVRFGGIEYGTNFRTQPNLITFPLPSVRGQAIIPSNINVFVNNILQQQQNINTGPFYLKNIPVVTGAGTISVLTQDILGRQQLVSVPYYASQALLRPGLDDYAVQIGAVRNNYGIDSFDYGRFLLNGKYDRGINTYLTLDTHAELLFSQQVVGETAEYLWNNYGIWTFSVAGSHANQGSGILGEVGFTRQTDRFSYGEDAITATSNFTQVGLQSGQMSPTLTLTSYTGYTKKHFGSLSASFTWTQNRQPNFIVTNSFATLPSSQIVTISYGREIFHRTSLVISGLVDLKNHLNNQISAQLTWGLGDRKSVNAGVNDQYNSMHYFAQLQKTLPYGTGWGYDLSTYHNGIDAYHGSAAYQNNDGTYSARYSRIDNTNNTELNARGSIMYFAGDTFFSREAQQSFALVRVPKMSGVRVYYRNELIGKTNNRGDLFISGLLPYQENNIRINVKDLPIDASFNEDQKTVVPYLYSGVLVTFKTSRNRSAYFHLILPNGLAIPTYANVILLSQKKIFPVGYDGAVYATHLLSQNETGKAQWENNVCYFRLHLPKNQATSFYDLGKISCH